MVFFIVIIFSILAAGCDGPSLIEQNDDEQRLMEHMVNMVSVDLRTLGFPIDLDQIDIEVLDPDAMSDMFTQISNSADHNVNRYTPFAPHLGSEKNTKALSKHVDDESDERLAFYDPNSKTIVFRRNSSRRLTKGYLAHELAHAYQDQSWGFKNIWGWYHQSPSREKFNITQFLIEGHAELIRQTFEQTYLVGSSKKYKSGTILGKFSEDECVLCDEEKPIPNLPYSLGLRFLLQQYRKGGWQAVENLFRRLPSSTEQLIHPQKYRKDEPTSVRIPEWTDKKLGVSLVEKSTLGEAYLLQKLLSLSLAPDVAVKVASGWDGDMAHQYRAANGHEILLWRIIFDRTLDAQQMEKALVALGLSKQVFRLGRSIDWIESDDGELTRALKEFLSRHPQGSMKGNMKDEESTRKQEESMGIEEEFSYRPYYSPKIFLGPRK